MLVDSEMERAELEVCEGVAVTGTSRSGRLVKPGT